MRIDEALAESKSLAVQFSKGTLNIEYRPPSYTIKEMKSAIEGKEDPERLADMIQDLIVGWDLTRVEKVPYDPETTAAPFDREVPVDVTNREDVINYVPHNIIMGIIKAIRADNDASGE